MVQRRLGKLLIGGGANKSIGATFDVAHGHTSCVMLPPVLAYNASVNGERQAVLAQQMGRPGEPLSRVVAQFVRQLGLPGSLQDLRIGDEHLRDIAQRALAYRAGAAQPAAAEERRRRDGDPAAGARRRALNARLTATAPQAT